jgi:hypothetical protein
METLKGLKIVQYLLALTIGVLASIFNSYGYEIAAFFGAFYLILQYRIISNPEKFELTSTDLIEKKAFLKFSLNIYWILLVIVILRNIIFPFMD